MADKEDITTSGDGSNNDYSSNNSEPLDEQKSDTDDNSDGSNIGKNNENNAGEGGLSDGKQHTEPKSAVETTAPDEKQPTSKTERLKHARRDATGNNRVHPEVTTVKPNSTSGEPYNSGGTSDKSTKRGPRFKRHSRTTSASN